MKIVVGSTNPAKVEAVREILADYPHLMDAEVVGVAADSGVGEQPKSLDEVTTGAMNRAKHAFGECDFSVGLEAGFMQVPGSKSGHMNVNAAAIYDGSEMHLGLSSAFETPDREVMRLVMEEGMNLSEAAVQAGLEKDVESASRQGGVVGAITKGRVERKEYVKQSLRMALAHIDT